MCPESSTKDWRGTFCWLHTLESGADVAPRPDVVTTSPTLLGFVLVWSQQISVDRKVSSPSRAAAPVILPRGNASMKNE